MTDPARYGIEPCAYELPFAADAPVKIERRGAETVEGGWYDIWAITRVGCCLNHDGEWEVEPQPSSRSAEFVRRTRYTLSEAVGMAARHFGLSEPMADIPSAADSANPPASAGGAASTHHPAHQSDAKGGPT